MRKLLEIWFKAVDWTAKVLIAMKKKYKEVIWAVNFFFAITRFLFSCWRDNRKKKREAKCKS